MVESFLATIGYDELPRCMSSHSVSVRVWNAVLALRNWIHVFLYFLIISPPNIITSLIKIFLGKYETTVFCCVSCCFLRPFSLLQSATQVLFK